ncbi:hypothetical protein I552_0423 [Mycobacterium xenopi 3993]|nr:hypothetical protein I552_0423 [Mycobacterium xenopi 3993]
MGSKSALLPLIADCERGLGRPERAIELARDRSSPAQRRRCRRIAYRRRWGPRDLGQLEQALTVLSTPRWIPSHRIDRRTLVLRLR